MENMINEFLALSSRASVEANGDKPLSEKEKEHYREIMDLCHSAVRILTDIEKGADKKLYFAYGSNMDPKQMAERCPSADFVGKGILRDHTFGIDAKGFATVISSPGNSVEGLIWKINESDIVTLDNYEGVRKNCYRKEYLPVMYADSEFKALIYISNRSSAEFSDRPEYMDKIISAAKANNFSAEYVRMIKSHIKA